MNKSFYIVLSTAFVSLSSCFLKSSGDWGFVFLGVPYINSNIKLLNLIDVHRRVGEINYARENQLKIAELYYTCDEDVGKARTLGGGPF